MMISLSFAEPPVPHFVFRSLERASRSSWVPINPLMMEAVLPPRCFFSIKILRSCCWGGRVVGSDGLS